MDLAEGRLDAAQSAAGQHCRNSSEDTTLLRVQLFEKARRRWTGRWRSCRSSCTVPSPRRSNG
ncbi:MAG: hypothetical protein ACLUHE_00175 [Christensenellales bacterium]